MPSDFLFFVVQSGPGSIAWYEYSPYVVISIAYSVIVIVMQMMIIQKHGYLLVKIDAVDFNFIR